MNIISFSTVDSMTALKHAKDLGEYSDASGDFGFDFSGRCSYDPFGMLITSAAIRQFVNRNPNTTRHCNVDNDDATRYAGHMGFFKAISENLPFGKYPGEAKGSRTYVPITCIDLSTIQERALRDQTVIQQKIQQTANNLGIVLSQGDSALQHTITYIIREIIRNSEEHSRANHVWLCAQYWGHYNLVEIGILDEGIGIRRSLKSNRAYSSSIQDDASALKLCVLPGITEAYKRDVDENDVWANSGYGLYMAKEICAALNGMFLVASGNVCIGFRVDSTTNTRVPIYERTSICGTAICLRFHTNSIGDFDSMRNDILIRGQDEARYVKNTVKRASYSSKGLIDLL